MKIVAVSYLNTLPFIYGIKHSNILSEAELILEVPAMCTQWIMEGKADVGLIPVASLKNIPASYRIITDFCIGGNGKVDSVLLLSQKPLNEISEIYLDTHSQTSVKLVKVLANKLWKINPVWKSNAGFENPESVVLIGDKTFSEKKKYAYCYDLCEAWQQLTGLPFVFACWVAKDNVSDEFCNTLNAALQYGIEHIAQVVEETQYPGLTKADLSHYYNTAIQYPFDTKKKEALSLFLKEL